MNMKHYEKLRRSIDEWNGWRNSGNGRSEKTGAVIESLLDSPDLSGADFSDMDFGQADLSRADLTFCNFCGADLSKCSILGARLDFLEYDDLTKWPPNTSLPSTARGRRRNDGPDVSAFRRSYLENSRGGTRSFYEEVAAIYAVAETARRALPERPNDQSQIDLLSIIDMLLRRTESLTKEIETNQSTINHLKNELEKSKAEARRGLKRLLDRAGDSVADQAGPIVKVLITSSSVTAIAAYALKSILS